MHYTARLRKALIAFYQDCSPRTDGERCEGVHHHLLALRTSFKPALRTKLGRIRPPNRLVPVKTVDRHAESSSLLEMMTEDGGAAGRDLAGQSCADRGVQTLTFMDHGVEVGQVLDGVEGGNLRVN